VLAEVARGPKVDLPSDQILQLELDPSESDEPWHALGREVHEQIEVAVSVEVTVDRRAEECESTNPVALAQADEFALFHGHAWG
jgi:hypothetical protein